jgi:hypothetical protein
VMHAELAHVAERHRIAGGCLSLEAIFSRRGVSGCG